MSLSTAKSDRITAMVSTLVAVAILAGGVTAYQSYDASVHDVMHYDTVQLESDFRFQLEGAFRHDPNDRAARLKQLEQVTQAWEQSPRTTADREKLANWLLESTARSIPGSIENLPAVPDFGAQLAAQRTPKQSVKPPVNRQDLKRVEQVPTSASLASAGSKNDPVTAPDSESSQVLVKARTTQQPTAAASETAKLVRINLTELSARTAGYHEGLDEVERELDTLEPSDVTALAEQVRQLEAMARDYRFVKLYYESLTAQERRAVAAPRPMADVLAKIERLVDRSQAAQSGDFLDEFDTSHQDRFGELRRKLAEIADRINR